MSSVGKCKVCRRCGEQTYDFDSETGEWWCGECDSEADV